MGETHEETVVLTLEDKLSSGTQAATGALGRLEAQIIREQGALARLQADATRASATLKGIASGDANGVVNIGAYRRAGSAIEALGNKATAQKDKIAALQERLAKLRAPKPPKVETKGGEKAFKTLGEASRVLGGESGRLSARITGLGKSIFGLGPYVAAAVVGLVVLTSAVAAVVGIVVKGISVADEYRDATLELASAGVTLWNANRASIASGEALLDTIGRVSQGTSIAREKVMGYATSLKNSIGFMGQQIFTGKQLESTLKTAALVASGGNDSLARSYIETAKTVRLFGGDLEKLDERMRKKFGAVAEAKLLSLSVQMTKLKEKIAFVFSGADVAPFLRGLQSILGIFNQDEAAAQSLRNGVTKMVETSIGWMLRFAIALVRVYIYLKTHELAWKGIGLAIKGIGVVFGVLVAIVLAGLALIALNVAVTVAVFGAIAAAIGFVVSQFQYAYGHMSEIWEGLKLLFSDGFKALGNLAEKALEIGKAIVMGIANGITGAGAAVFNALKGAVKGAVDGVKNFLESHSPSELLRREVGYQMGAGVAVGNEDAAPEIAKSSRAMVGAGVGAARAESVGSATPKSTPAEGGGHVVSFTNCNFGDNSEAGLRKIIMSLLEGETLAAPEPS